MEDSNSNNVIFNLLDSVTVDPCLHFLSAKLRTS
jgi:hypothetical protein